MNLSARSAPSTTQTIPSAPPAVAPAPMLVWRRLIPVRLEDAWAERLRFVGRERLVFTLLPSGRTMRAEAYGLSAEEGAILHAAFGGELRRLAPEAWQPAFRPEHPPLLIRDSLLVANSPEQFALCRQQFPERHHLLIPAGMAFGTGEHVTTGTCLRFLTDVVAHFAGRPWTLLDAGTGTGILALAAEKLGATAVDAWDFDPDAVKISRENGAANGSRRVRFAEKDVLEWEPSPEQGWNVVVANIYAEVLLRVLPKFVASLRPGGCLVMSGILRAQADACLQAATAEGLEPRSARQTGKWFTAWLVKPG